MATPNRTYLSDGQVLESPPLSARVSRSIDNIYNFFGLYFVSLFSVCATQLASRRELAVQYSEPTKLTSDTSAMGLIEYAKGLRRGRKWPFKWGRSKKTDGDGGRDSRARVQQLRVTVLRAQGRDIRILIENEGSEDILVPDSLVEDLTIPAEVTMEITITPHARGPALLCQRRLHYPDQGPLGELAAWSPYDRPDTTPAIELIVPENAYRQQDRMRFLIQYMDRVQLEEMIVWARINQGICLFSTLGLTVEQLREAVLRDFYDTDDY